MKSCSRGSPENFEIPIVSSYSKSHFPLEQEVYTCYRIKMSMKNFEFKGNKVYIVSSRTTRATTENASKKIIILKIKATPNCS